MRALVVGASGYLGDNLCMHLLECGHEVVGLARAALKNDFADYSSWQGIVVDCSSMVDVKHVPLDGVDVIYVMAGKTGTLDGFEEYHKYINDNQLVLLNVLRHVVDKGSSARIVFPSSRLVYRGKKGIKLVEGDEKSANSVYAINKIACESYLEAYSRFYGLDYTVYRVCVPYGHLSSNSYGYGTLSLLTNQAKANGRINLFGDGLLSRTFTHIHDLCSILESYSQMDETTNRILNIGGGDHCSLFDLANLIASKYRCPIEFSPWPEAYLKLESGDTMFDDGLLQSIKHYSYKHRLRDFFQ